MAILLLTYFSFYPCYSYYLKDILYTCLIGNADPLIFTTTLFLP